MNSRILFVLIVLGSCDSSLVQQQGGKNKNVETSKPTELRVLSSTKQNITSKKSPSSETLKLSIHKSKPHAYWSINLKIAHGSTILAESQMGACLLRPKRFLPRWSTKTSTITLSFFMGSTLDCRQLSSSSWHFLSLLIICLGGIMFRFGICISPFVKITPILYPTMIEIMPLECTWLDLGKHEHKRG